MSRLSGKDWTGNKKSTYVTLGASSHSSGVRHSEDYYATDPKTIDELMQKDKRDYLERYISINRYSNSFNDLFLRFGRR